MLEENQDESKEKCHTEKCQKQNPNQADGVRDVAARIGDGAHFAARQQSQDQSDQSSDDQSEQTDVTDRRLNEGEQRQQSQSDRPDHDQHDYARAQRRHVFSKRISSSPSPSRADR